MSHARIVALRRRPSLPSRQRVCVAAKNEGAQNYAPATWAKLIKNPEDRRDAARQYIESVGGKLHGFWYAFGEHDGYNLWEAPDNVAMAAAVLAINAGGALNSAQTTVLLSVEETMAALQKASSIKYRPPGEKG